jgi:hypothetical protein
MIILNKFLQLIRINKLIITAFDDEEDRTQTITYLKNKMGKYTVTRETLEFKITPKFCLLYLSMRFSNRKITREDIHKLHTIFLLLWKKCNIYKIDKNVLYMRHIIITMGC